MRSLISIVLPLIASLSSASLEAQGVAASVGANQQSNQPYEIIVTPKLSVGDIQKLIVKVEDDFFERFNELNLDDDYDIFCERVAPTMSHIRRRVCEAKYHTKARAENSGMYIDDLINTNGKGGWLFTERQLRNETFRDSEILVEKLEGFVEKDEDLRGISYVLAELRNKLKRK